MQNEGQDGAGLFATGEMAERVRRYAWSATSLGAIEGWPEPLRTVVDLALTCTTVASVAAGADRLLIYNDAAGRIYGDQHPGALGRPLASAFPETYPVVAPLYDRAFAGEAIQVRAQPLGVGNGRNEVFDAYLTPVRNGAGEVVAVHMVGLELGERNAAETALRESETRFRAFITATADVVYMMSPDWSEMHLLEGRGFLPDTDAPSGEWLDRYIHPGDQASVGTAIDQAILSKTPFEMEHRVIRADGSLGLTHSRAVPILGAGGEIVEWVGAASDVTADRATETKLRESEALRSVALAGGQMGTWRWDLDAALIWGDSQFWTLWGYPPSDDPRPLTDFIHRMSSKSTAEVAAVVAKAIEAGEQFDGPLEIVTGPNTGRWLRWQGRVDLHNTKLLYGVSFDITEQTRTEAALRESEERLQVALASANLGAFVWHVAEDRTEADARALAHFGLRSDSPITLAEALTSTFHPDDGRRYAEAVERAIDPAGPGRLHEEFRIRRLDGQERWMSVSALTAFDGAPRVALRLTGVLADITERKRVEATLQASEERQAFLLKLSDALRPLIDPVEVLQTAMRLVKEHFDVDSAVYHEFDALGDRVVTREGITNERIDMPDVWRLKDFGFEEDLKAGRAIWYEDTETDPRLKDSLPSYRATRIRAGLGVTLMKGGRLAAMVGLTDSEPRAWPEDQRRLVETVADRTWDAVERARAEAALRDSEARFTEFAKASSAGIWIRNAATLAMEYVSPAISTIYGVEPDTVVGSIEKWAAMIVPEDRDVALAHIESARQGDSVVHEFRIQRRSDQAFRWIRNTDFPLDHNGRIERVGGIAEDVTDAKLSVEHQAVLLAELQHRVRNIMAIIRSIVSRTAESADSVHAYAASLSGRLLTLARVQALLTRAANATVSLAAIVHEELSAQAAHSGQFEVQGPDVELSPKAAETMTLAIHELTTNALKYGALSTAEGLVRVRWQVVEKRGINWLDFKWSESGAPPGPNPPGPRRRGFGSELIEGRIPYELKGRGTIEIEAGGAQCQLEFPLQQGPSVLETGSPKPTTVFGGIIDMTGEADLRGRTILVLEDDYYLAMDTARALKGAGAEVIGPFPTEAAARNQIADVTLSGAVLDINLEGGRSFDLARELKTVGTPFIFVTGYDQDVVPDEFEGTPRLQKPVEFRKVIAVIADTFNIPA